MRNTEPVLTAAAAAGIIAAGFSFIRLMGWLDMTDDQFNQLMIFVGLLLPFIFAWVARSQVTPTNRPQAVNTEGNLVALSPTDGTKLPNQV